MTKYIWHNDQWVRAVRKSRPSSFPSIIRDTMDACLHPATGEMIDSKREFRRITRAHKLIEVGDEAPMISPNYEPEGVVDDVAGALTDLRNGMPFEDAAPVDGETRFYEVNDV